MVPETVQDLALRQDLVLPALLQRRAEDSPNHEFLYEVGGGSRTYAQLNLAARKYGRFFSDIGISHGEVVATFLPTSINALEVWLGLSWAGGVEAALNREYRQRILAEVLNDTQATVVVTTRDFLSHLTEVRSDLTHLRRVVLVDGFDGEAAPPVLPGVEVIAGGDEGIVNDGLERLPELPLHEPSCILYTSGTTGPSKGVVLPWAQMIENGKYMVPIEHMNSSDVFYCPYAPCHITGKAYFYSMMLLGGSYVIKSRFRTGDFWPDIRRYGCTTTLLQGAMAHFLLRQEVTDDERDNPLTQVVVAPVIPEVAALEGRFEVTVGTVYNMTELSCPVMSHGWYNSGTGSCGTPRVGVEARVVDELDRELPRGQVGELVVRHSDPWTLTSGYLRRPETTADAFANLWFHTGDAFYQHADGSFFFVDRTKDSIRRRGENISSAEVEREVREFPAVRECAAIAHPSDLGEDEVRIVVVPKDKEFFEPAELYTFLTERMPRYMLPMYIDIVDEIPKTETQKIQKNALRKLPVTSSTWKVPTRTRP